jgi:hypothetical protein
LLDVAEPFGLGVQRIRQKRVSPTTMQQIAAALKGVPGSLTVTGVSAVHCSLPTDYF